MTRRKGPPSLRPLDVALWLFEKSIDGAWKVLFFGYDRISDYEQRRLDQERRRFQ